MGYFIQGEDSRKKALMSEMIVPDPVLVEKPSMQTGFPSSLFRAVTLTNSSQTFWLIHDLPES